MINSHITAAVAADRHRTLLAQAHADSLAGQARALRQSTSGVSSKAPRWTMLSRLRVVLSRAQLQPPVSPNPNAAAAEPSIVAWASSRTLGLTTLGARLADEVVERADAAHNDVTGLCAAPC